MINWIIKPRQLSYCLVVLLLYFGSPLNAQNTQQQSKTIVLDGPSESAQALYAQALLERAYQRIGYQVTYRKIPLARSFIEANSGRLDGLRARVDNLESEYSNLIKVPFALFHFELIMVADRRICGICDVSWVNELATARGFKAFENYIEAQELKPRVVYVPDLNVALDLALEGRVTGAIMSSVSLPHVYDKLNHHWIKKTLSFMPDYHYVHKRHEALVPLLVAELTAMQASGELHELQKKFDMEGATQPEQKTDFGTISAISASWVGFTDTTQGTYIKTLNDIYADVTDKVEVNLANWKRAKQLFYDGRADILIGAYPFEVVQGTIRSEVHIDYEVPVIALAKEADRLSAMLAGDLNGTACYLLGYEFDSALPETITSYEAPTANDCMRLLESGRVDMLLDYEVDLPQSLVARFEKQQVLDWTPLFMVFQDTPRGHKLKRRFEREFSELVRSGKLKQYFARENEFFSANLLPKVKLETKND